MTREKEMAMSSPSPIPWSWPVALVALACACPANDDDVPADDDSSAADDDSSVADDDSSAADDDSSVADDDSSAADDDDSAAQQDCDLAWVGGEIVRDPALAPIPGALKVEVMAFEPEQVAPDYFPAPGWLDIDVMYTPGPLLDEGDSYEWRLCVEPGDVAIIASVDANWDDDAFTPGDYLGHGLGTVVADGSALIDVVLDHVLTEEDCQH